MKRNILICLVLVLLVVFLAAGVAQAKPEYVQQIPADVEPKSCNLCHTSSIPELNSNGKAWAAAGKDWSVFKPKAESKSSAAENESKPAAAKTEGATAAGASKELPQTGGVPYLFVIPGLAAIIGGLLLRSKRA